jgi:hypothetical protein
MKANNAPGARRLCIQVAHQEPSVRAGVGIDVDHLIEEVLAEMRAALASALLRGGTTRAFTATWGDRAIWDLDSSRLLAVVRASPSGRPIISRFHARSRDATTLICA